MSKVTIKGIVKAVTANEKIQNSETTVAKLLLVVPARQDEFGEKKGDDQIFQINCFNLKGDVIQIVAEGQKIIADCYLQSRPSKSKDFDGYNLSLSLIKHTTIE